MDTQTRALELYWIKDAFKFNYSIYSGNKLVGEVKQNTTNRSVLVHFFGKKYVFEKSGFLNPRFDILNVSDKKEIGRIQFKSYTAKATIQIDSERYLWKFKHPLTRKWIIKDRQNQIVMSGKKRKEGQILIQDESESVLFLSSLIIRNHLAMLGYA